MDRTYVFRESDQWVHPSSR